LDGLALVGSKWPAPLAEDGELIHEGHEGRWSGDHDLNSHEAEKPKSFPEKPKGGFHLRIASQDFARCVEQK
jgi:hypothetical protein